MLRVGFLLLVTGLLTLVALAVQPRAADLPGGNRIVSIGGAVTETVFTLGAGDRLVAVDSTSLYPDAATRLPDVGYMRQLSAEPILAMRPTLILVEEGAGPKEALDHLRAAGVPLVLVPNEHSIEGAAQKILAVGTALGLQPAAERAAAEVRSGAEAVRTAIAPSAERPRVLFLLSVGSGAPLAAGRDSSAAAIIELAGGLNALDQFEGFKPLSPEALAAADPDYILVTTRTEAASGGLARLRAVPGVAQTSAAAAGRIIAIDGLLLLGFGPRTALAMKTLAKQLHPTLPLPTPTAH